jgi:hypothetical protein
MDSHAQARNSTDEELLKTIDNLVEERETMVSQRDIAELDEALRHCAAGLKALEAARAAAGGGTIYPTHIHLAAVELAHAIEASMKVALRNQ